MTPAIPEYTGKGDQMAYSSRRLLPQNLQDCFIKLLSPLVKLFSKWGLSPNSFTIAGVIITSLGAAAFLMGFIRLAGIFILLGGLCDTIDGLLARTTGKASRFLASLLIFSISMTMVLRRELFWHYAVHLWSVILEPGPRALDWRPR